jgi:hypothetical protein
LGAGGRHSREGIDVFCPSRYRVVQRVSNDNLQSIRARFDQRRKVRAIGSEQERRTWFPIDPKAGYITNLAKIEQYSLVLAEPRGIDLESRRVVPRAGEVLQIGAFRPVLQLRKI